MKQDYQEFLVCDNALWDSPGYSASRYYSAESFVQRPESSAESSALEQDTASVADDYGIWVSYRGEAVVEPSRDTVTLPLRNTLPMVLFVAMEEYDLDTSIRAYRLPTTSRATRHHRRSERYRHSGDIVGTSTASPWGE